MFYFGLPSNFEKNKSRNCFGVLIVFLNEPDDSYTSENKETVVYC